MGTIFPPHIWCLHGFQKMPHKTDIPNYDTDTTGLASRVAFVTGSNEKYDNSALIVSHYYVAHHAQLWPRDVNVDNTAGLEQAYG